MQSESGTSPFQKLWLWLWLIQLFLISQRFGLVYLLFYVTINDNISVIFVTAHRCAVGLKKAELRSGSHAIDISLGSLRCPSKVSQSETEKKCKNRISVWRFIIKCSGERCLACTQVIVCWSSFGFSILCKSFPFQLKYEAKTSLDRETIVIHNIIDLVISFRNNMFSSHHAFLLFYQSTSYKWIHLHTVQYVTVCIILSVSSLNQQGAFNVILHGVLPLTSDI